MYTETVWQQLMYEERKITLKNKYQLIYLFVSVIYLLISVIYLSLSVIYLVWQQINKYWLCRGNIVGQVMTREEKINFQLRHAQVKHIK